MSSLEVVDGINAVIAILDGVVKVWHRARKDVNLSRTFETVANRLPILNDTLRTCYDYFKLLQTTLPGNVVQALLGTVRSCEIKAQKLRMIFEQTISGDDNRWYDRYRKATRSIGKGSRVEELMKAITEDVQNLVSNHSVNMARPDLSAKLAELIHDIEEVEPSLPTDDVTSQIFNVYSGVQHVSTGSSRQYISHTSDGGTTHNIGGITGNPIFNFGKS